VSHSTVARRVEALEERLAARLFDRTRDGYTLTEAGRRMLDVAERVEREMSDLERGLVGVDERLEGPVALTCSDHFIAVLRKAFGLLKPGGFFVSSTVCLGESWVPLTPVLRVMRWLGRAPAVWPLARAALVSEIAEAGFVDVTEPDVGASPKISFVMATRP
jgi:hypothetical protein